MSNIFRNPDNLVDVVRSILAGEPIEEKKKEEELDPVNKQAVKKKFDDRKDKDIDNDGDVDSTDKYLHKRRKAISKSLNEKEPKKKINASHCEEVELDENYRKAALKGIGAETANSIKVGTGVDYYSPKDGSKHMGKITRMDKNGYEVKDEKTGKTFKFKYYSKDAMKEEKRNCGCEQDPCITYGDQTVKEAELDEQLAKIKGGSPADAGRRAAVEDDIARAKKAGDKKLVKKLEEASDEDGDGEKKTAAQKADMDGDGEKDTGEKKKKKKKDEKGEKEDEAKPDKVNTEPEMENVKTMMSKREMTDKEKAKLDKLKKKYEGGEMHKSIKDQYGDKADEVFYGKLTKMAMGEGVDLNEAEGSVKVKAGPNHDRKLKSIIDLAKKMGLKVTRQGKSDDGKMTTVHLKGNQKKIIDMQALGPRLDEGVELEEDKKELAKISKELEGASKMHKGQSDRIKKIIGKDDVKEAKDDEKDTNLIMQLRKAVSLRGNKVDFKQGTEVVPANVAQAFLTKYAKLKRPAEKDMLSQSAHKSLKHLKMAIKGKVEKPKSSGVDLPKLKSEK